MLAGCPGESAAAVLESYGTAYSERDVGALEALYSEDYVWLLVMPPRVEIIERDRTVEAARKMLGDPDVESVALVFGGDYTVVPGQEPGTWRIEDVIVTLDVALSPKSDHGSTGKTVSACETFYVREVGADPILYEIYEEVTFEGMGCGEDR